MWGGDTLYRVLRHPVYLFTTEGSYQPWCNMKFSSVQRYYRFNDKVALPGKVQGYPQLQLDQSPDNLLSPSEMRGSSLGDVLNMAEQPNYVVQSSNHFYHTKWRSPEAMRTIVVKLVFTLVKNCTERLKERCEADPQRAAILFGTLKKDQLHEKQLGRRVPLRPEWVARRIMGYDLYKNIGSGDKQHSDTYEQDSMLRREIFRLRDRLHGTATAIPGSRKASPPSSRKSAGSSTSGSHSFRTAHG